MKTVGELDCDRANSSDGAHDGALSRSVFACTHIPRPSRSLARRLIDTTLSDEMLLTAVAQRSTFHENGFAKIPLRVCPTASVRLHIWQTCNRTLRTENIHDHRFSFHSCVLFGALEHRFWRCHPSGKLKSRFDYYPAEDAEPYRLHYSGEDQLASYGIQRIYAGQTYSITAGELHQVRAVEPSSITMLVEDRSQLLPYARVYSKRYGRMCTEIRPRRLSVVECAIMLREVATMLTGRWRWPLPIAQKSRDCRDEHLQERRSEPWPPPEMHHADRFLREAYRNAP